MATKSEAFVAAALLLVCLAAPAQQAVYRLNAGGSWYTDGASNLWEPDTPYRQYGYVGLTSAPIGGTLDDVLYQSERYGVASQPAFGYDLPVAPGTYAVRLHFAEIYDGITAQNPRVFDVLIEGALALDNYNIFATVGYATAKVEQFTVTVADSTLDIDFIAGQENPKISAIEVLTASAPEPTPQLSVSPAQLVFGDVQLGTSANDSITLGNSGGATLQIDTIALSGSNAASFALQHAALPIVLAPGATAPLNVTFTPGAAGPASASIGIGSNDPAGAKLVPLSGVGIQEQQGVLMRINAGGPQYTDPAGNVWQSDAGLYNTGAASSTNKTIAGTTLQGLYRTQRRDPSPPPAMLYTIPLPSGPYTVNLHFAEIQYSAVGKRVFDVALEGSLVLNDLDVVAEVGSFRALAKTFEVVVADSALNIGFTRVVNNPMISGIEILGQQTSVLAVNPNAWNFGAIAIGSTSSANTFTISNSGTVATQLQQIALAGTNADDFLIASAPALPATIPASGSISFAAAFRPTAAGPRSASIQLTLAGGQQMTVAVSGTGESVTPPPTNVVYRVNAGGNAYTDGLGNAWTSDATFYNTGSVFSTTSPIAGTTDDVLYQTERWDVPGAPEMLYSFPVEAGAYTVRLHFAEIYFTAPGQRVFDVVIEGQPALTNFDIFSEAGALTAVVKQFNINVADSSLQIEFLHKVENPKISAIEILSASTVTPSVSLLSWGHVPLNTSGGNQSFTLTNTGGSPVTISNIAFNITEGTGQGFTATIGSNNYNGGASNVSYPVNIALNAGASITVTANFTPTVASDNDVSLEFSGAFGSAAVRLLGIGGEHQGDPYLHVVIDKPAYVVDHDQNGAETVMLRGDLSHTHEIGRNIVQYEWVINGSIVATTPNVSYNFALGDTTVVLTIWDDNTPPRTLSDSAVVKVVAPDNVPGTLLKFYDSLGADPATLLDAVPAAADYAATTGQMYIAGGTPTIGPSGYTGNAMVQMLAQVGIPTSGNYQFRAVGGSARRLFLNGAAVTGPVFLTPGKYPVEARFAIPNLTYLPVYVEVSANGSPYSLVPVEWTTHTELNLPPVINEMPTEGNSSGGFPVVITGIGFVPVNQTVVRWGAATLSGSMIAVQPSSISFTAPAGSGTINVWVQNPYGSSNVRAFTYSGGVVAVDFSLSDVATGVALPTVATWGADGRLYVGTVEGVIKAYTVDDNYVVTATQTITTLQGLSNPAILGIASNPFDTTGAVRIYVSHSQLYANGGSCFTGFSPYSGQISILTGPSFNTVTPLITGLPVSNHDHGINALEFDNNGDLLICVGGLTNAGILHCNMGGLNESPFSGAILRARLSTPGFNGTTSYVVSGTTSINMDQVFGGSVDVADGVDVEVFASGFRNTFDMTLARNGRVYCTDNGPNIGFGVASTGPNTQTSSDVQSEDSLNLVEYGNYYGHPNRNRGRYDLRQNVYYNLTAAPQLGVFTQMLTSFPASTNGIFEYTANTFNGALRGELIAQQWNTTTYRTKLDATGTSVLSKGALPVSLNSLDVIGGPGGVIIGVNYSAGKVVAAKPIDSSATGLKVFDIYPWRASAAGGRPFVIGGNGFGSTSNTTVSIGGLNCTLTSVTPTRIKGVVPANSNPSADLLNVTVNTAGVAQVLTSAFRYLAGPGQDNTQASAYVAIVPGGNILSSSTYDANSFRVANTSTRAQKITRVRFDFRTALFRDIVFDPNGAAGDPVGKPFTVDTNPGLGTLAFAMTNAHDGGYDVLDITFTDFGPGKTLGFSADVDPTSIKGAPAPGPNSSGSISGIELIGAQVVVYFDDGTSHVATPYRIDASNTDSEALAAGNLPPPPFIEVLGITARNAVTSSANHTVRVFGSPGLTASLLRVEAGLYLAGVPGGGFDIDPFEANTAIAIAEQNAVIGAAGYVDFTVTLTRSDASAGRNHLVAALTNSQGAAGPTSETHVLQYNP